MRRFAPQLFAQLFCISLILVFFSNSQGQAPFPVTSQQQADNRLRALENLRRQPSQPFDLDQRLIQLAQLSLMNDFRALQMIHNKMMTRMFDRPAGKSMSPTEIRSSLGEIKKVAERLRSSFGFPKIKIKPAEPTNKTALAHGLLQLDKAVMSFVENPMFQQSRVFDIELASRAGRDLSEVLRLTDELRKLVTSP